MAGLIPNDFIEQLLDRTDIIEVIGNRIDLKKKGKDHWACCPFHQENSPSFSVNANKQFYYCFGCGASGTAVKFLQEYENLSFVEAIEELARMAGQDVPREEVSRESQQRQQQRRTLHDLMCSCADYFTHQLYQHPNAQQVQQYILSRGLTEETVRTFGIGFAPAGWDNLIQHYRSDKTNQELLTTGMLTQNEQGRIYDRFRNRLMFPIRDIKGRVIAFGGRVMSADEKPKYLNSPETPIFHKGSELYGLYEARKALKDFDNIIIVEGYMDVVALAQHKVRNAVATLGTATSTTHIQKLFKHTQELVFCFDGDNAGRRAAERALANCLSEIKDGYQVRFLFLPEGEDPDTIVQQEGFDGFMHRVKQAQSCSDFLFQHLQTQADISRLDGRAKLASLARGWIEKAPEGIFKQLLYKQLSDLIGLSSEQIIENYRVEKPDIAPPPEPESNPSNVAPAYPYHGETSTQHYSPEQQQPAQRHTNNRLGVRIGMVHRTLAWLIRYPELVLNIDVESLKLLPENADNQLLVRVVELLLSAPKKDLYSAFDYLCQHNLRAALSPIAESDYLWLEAHNEQQRDEKEFAKLELEKLISGLIHKAPDQEYEKLAERVRTLDPSLTDTEKQRYRELLAQKKRK